jgi:hypothetical protein
MSRRDNFEQNGEALVIRAVALLTDLARLGEVRLRPGAVLGLPTLGNERYAAGAELAGAGFS